MKPVKSSLRIPDSLLILALAMQTALTLTQKQIDRLMRYAKARMDAIANERSRWLEDRDKFELEHEGDFQHRAAGSVVFSKSNESLRIIASGVDYITARRIESIFKVDPWMSAEPRTKTADIPKFAEALARHWEYKLGADQMGFQQHAEEEIRIAGVVGECVSKIVHESVVDEFERIATILVDKSGKEVTDASGDFIFQENGMEQTTAPSTDPTQAGTPVTFQHPTEQPQIDMTQGYSWQQKTITDSRVRYVGAKPITLHRKEFYCPLKAKSIQESDFVAHATPVKLSTLRKQLGIYETLGPDGDVLPSTGDAEANNQEQLFRRLVDQIKSAPSEKEGNATEPKLAQGEGTESSTPDGDPEFIYVEAYMDIDPREDGRRQRVYFTFARDYDAPIFWEYLQNVTPNGVYPFNAVVNSKVPLRWYGESWYKKYQKQQDLIDKTINQITYRNSIAANPVKFRRKEAVIQWQDDQPFESTPDKVYDLNEGYSANDALQTQEIPELDEQTKFILETSISAWRTSSGVSTATDSSFGAMPAENTATGTQRIVASGNTLFEPLILEVTRGLENELRMLAKVQYENQDTEEFSFKQNNQWLQQTLTPEMVRGLEMIVSLKLSNLYATQKLQQAQQAIQNLGLFLQVPTPFKQAQLPLFAQLFQALQIDNADDILNSIVQIDQQLAAQSTGQPPSLKMQEIVQFKDLAAYPEAQIKMLVLAKIIDPADAPAMLERAQAQQQPEQPDDTGESQSNAPAPSGDSGPTSNTTGDQQGGPGSTGPGTNPQM